MCYHFRRGEHDAPVMGEEESKFLIPMLTGERAGRRIAPDDRESSAKKFRCFMSSVETARKTLGTFMHAVKSKERR